MSLRDLATDASCAPDPASSSSSAPPRNPLSHLTNTALTPPLPHDPTAPLTAPPTSSLLLSDLPPLPPQQLPPGPPPGPHTAPPLPHGVLPAGAAGPGHASFADEFLRGRAPPPMPAYFPRTLHAPVFRVPAPAPDAATARFEAAFARAARAGYAAPHGAPHPQMLPQLHPQMQMQQQYARLPAETQVTAAGAGAAGAQQAQREVDAVGAGRGEAATEEIRARARVRAREFFPEAGQGEVESRVEEFMGELRFSAENPVEGELSGVEEWMGEFSRMGIRDGAREISDRMQERREERMEQSDLKRFMEALGGSLQDADGLEGAWGALPDLEEREGVDVRGGESSTTTAGDGGLVSSWVDEFEGSLQSGEAAGMGVELENAYGDSFNADLYSYLGRDPASANYEFVVGQGEGRYSSFSAREALQEGIRLRNCGELSRAVQALERAVRQEETLEKPEAAEAWFLLGTTHAECDDDERAIQAFLRCAAIYGDGTTSSTVGAGSSDLTKDKNPFLSGALLALGVCYTNELNMPKALRYLREWLDHKMGGATMFPEGDILGGIPARSSVPMDDARAEHRDLVERLEKCAREDSGDAELSIALGVLYNLSRDYEKAANAMRAAVMLRPDDARLWNKLGATLANGNESDDALRAYRKAVDLSPSFIRAWVNVGNAYTHRSDYDKAARYYLKALSMQADRQRSGEASGDLAQAGAPVQRRALDGVSAFAAEGDMAHVWGYLRTTLVAMEREDLLPLVEGGSPEAFKQYIPF